MTIYDYARPQIIKEVDEYFDSLKYNVMQSIDNSLDESEIKNGIKPLCQKLITYIFDLDNLDNKERN